MFTYVRLITVLDKFMTFNGANVPYIFVVNIPIHLYCAFFIKNADV